MPMRHLHIWQWGDHFETIILGDYFEVIHFGAINFDEIQFKGESLDRLVEVRPSYGQINAKNLRKFWRSFVWAPVPAWPHLGWYGWNWNGLVGDVGATSGVRFGQIGWGMAAQQAENCQNLAEKTRFLLLLCPTARLVAQPHQGESGWNLKGLVRDVGAMCGSSLGEIVWCNGW